MVPQIVCGKGVRGPRGNLTKCYVTTKKKEKLEKQSSKAVFTMVVGQKDLLPLGVK